MMYAYVKKFTKTGAKTYYGKHIKRIQKVSVWRMLKLNFKRYCDQCNTEIKDGEGGWYMETVSASAKHLCDDCFHKTDYIDWD